MTDTKSTSKIPNPGSIEAIDLGCICPRMDNSSGSGAFIIDGEPQFWYTLGCPIHITEIEAIEKDEE